MKLSYHVNITFGGVHYLCNSEIKCSYYQTWKPNLKKKIINLNN